MKTITHKNMSEYLDRLPEEPYLKIGSNAPYDPTAWYAQEVILEVPMGEIVKGGLTMLALLGRTRPEPMPLTGKEGFVAQGLEGKIQIRKSLLNALLNLRDIVPPHRGRILLD